MQDILITPGSGEPQILFRGSGANDTAIELNVLSSYESASGSGTALVFEGTEGQLFAVTDNLSSGVIFSVSDITGLPAIEYNASGELTLGEYASSITLHADNGLYLTTGVPSDTTNALYISEGNLAFNGSGIDLSAYLPLAGGTMTGSLLFSADNTHDIGASGATRPRDVYIGRYVNIGAECQLLSSTGGGLRIGHPAYQSYAYVTNNELKVRSSSTIGFSSTADTSGASDTKLSRYAAGHLSVLGDVGVRIRNLADSADAALTAGSGTFTGDVIASGDITADSGIFTGDISITKATGTGLVTVTSGDNDSKINLVNYLGDTLYLHMQGGQRSAKVGLGSGYHEYGGAWIKAYGGGLKYLEFQQSTDRLMLQSQNAIEFRNRADNDYCSIEASGATFTGDVIASGDISCGDITATGILTVPAATYVKFGTGLNDVWLQSRNTLNDFWFRNPNTLQVNIGVRAQQTGGIHLSSQAGLYWSDSATSVASTLDVVAIKNAAGQLDVRGNSGLRIRDYANTADASLTAGSGTFTGTIASDGRVMIGTSVAALSSPYLGLDINAPGNPLIRFFNTSSQTASILTDGSEGFKFTSTAGDITFVSSNTNTTLWRNGVNGQTLRIANTYTSATNAEWFQIKASGTEYQLGSMYGTAGGSARDVKIGHFSESGVFTPSLTVTTSGSGVFGGAISGSTATMTGGSAVSPGFDCGSSAGIYTAGAGFLNFTCGAASTEMQYNAAAGQLWIKTNAATTQYAMGPAADIKLYRNTSGQLDIRADSGTRIRNNAGTADANLTAASGTFSGDIVSSGDLTAVSGVFSGDITAASATFTKSPTSTILKLNSVSYGWLTTAFQTSGGYNRFQTITTSSAAGIEFGTSGSAPLYLNPGGNVLVGVTAATGGKLQVRATTEQLRLEYDVSNAASFTVSSGGNLTVAPSGGTTTFTAGSAKTILSVIDSRSGVSAGDITVVNNTGVGGVVTIGRASSNGNDNTTLRVRNRVNSVVMQVDTGNNRTLIGTGTDDGVNLLQVAGATKITGTLTVTGDIVSSGNLTSVSGVFSGNVAASGMTLSYDASNYATHTVDSVGTYSITATGTTNSIKVGGETSNIGNVMVYQYVDNSLVGIRSGSTTRWLFRNTELLPQNLTQYLGSAAYRFINVYSKNLDISDGIAFRTGAAVATTGDVGSGYGTDWYSTADSGTMHVVHNSGTSAIDVVGLMPTGSYVPSNYSESRTFDASTVTVSQLADIVATLINDLKWN